MKFNRHVLITGGSSGIGASLVLAFAREGDRVTFTFCSGRIAAEKLCAASESGQVRAVSCDFNLQPDIDRLVAEVGSGVDVLIHNAAVGTKSVEKYEKDAGRQELLFMNVNALSPMRLTNGLLPAMKKAGAGKIVFISSVDGGIAQFPGSRYADGMSKAALTHFAKQLAAELVMSPLDIYTICPGATDTPMFQASTLNSMNEEQRKAFLQSIPAGRLVQPEEIADLALLLCSPLGKVLRGAVIDASLGIGSYPGVIRRG